MSSSKDNTTLFLELSKAFLSTQLLEAKKSADGRDTSTVGVVSAWIGVRDVKLSKSKQSSLEEFAKKFERITLSAPVVFVSTPPPCPPQSLVHGVVYVSINQRRVIECTLLSPWGEVVTEVLQEFKTPAQIDCYFLEAHHFSIKTALINKGLILEVNEALVDSCAKGVLQNLIQRCLRELESKTGTKGNGQTGKYLEKLPKFVEILYTNFERAQLLSVPYHAQDAFDFFRKYAGAYLLEKLWKTETTVWDFYSAAGEEKVNMLIKELNGLKQSLDHLHADNEEGRKAEVCHTIRSVLLQNFVICQRNRLTPYMPLSAVINLPFSISFGTDGLVPGMGVLEQMVEAVYLRINEPEARGFLTQYIDDANKGTAKSPAPSHPSRFFSPPAPSASPGYYAHPGYTAYPGPGSHVQHVEYSAHSPHADTSRSYGAPRHPEYPVYPERQAFPGHVPQSISRPPLPPKPAELAGLPLPLAHTQHPSPEGVQDTIPSAEPPASPQSFY